MRKFRFFLDFKNEERWLEEMARKGFHFRNHSFGYSFHRCKPEMATYRIDFRKFKKQEDFIDYITLFEDSGWEHLHGNKNKGIQYFKKTESATTDTIFSDKTSESARYKRYATMFFELAVSFLPILIVFYFAGIIEFKAFIDPKELYFTPGLWEKTGVSFWFSFLFETPFALARGFAWMIIPVSILLYMFFGLRSQHLYLREK